jgi:hypothetical protein
MKRILGILSMLLIALVTVYDGFGEGTAQVMPTALNGTGLIVSTTAAFPLGNVGSYRGCAKEDRVYFNIKDFTKERLYWGFHFVNLSVSTPINVQNKIYMRVYNPSGTVVLQILLPTGGAGFITSYASAVAGPNIGGATPAGYTPNNFTPLVNGDYWVEFYESNNGGLTANPAGYSIMSNWFDMTVAETNNTQYPGRVHSQKWAFSVYNPANLTQLASISSDASFYTYTPDSVVDKIDFTPGFKPLSFIVAVNSYGVVNTGNWLVDRKSINASSAPALLNGYPVFLNLPDPILYPPCPIPLAPSLVNPIIAGCPPGPYFVRYNAPQLGDYYILLDLNGVAGYQGGTSDVFFEMLNVPAGIASIAWNGLNGLGVPVPANTTFPVTFYFRKGRVNVPLYDAELNINGFSLTGISPIAMPAARMYWDDSQITNIGTLCDGTGATNSNNLTGIGYKNDITGQAAPGHAWNGDGNPTFANPAPSVLNTTLGLQNDVDNWQCNDFGNARLINTWAWGIELSATQNLTLACVDISGTVWDDADNSAAGTFINIQTGGEGGTNAAGALYATLVDPLTGQTLVSVPVAANGTYTLSGAPISAIGMSVVISTVAGVPGTTAPTPSVPANWVGTSPLTRTFNTGFVAVTGLDFGVDDRPISAVQNYTIANPAWNSYMTLNGPGTPSAPGPLTGTDTEDGTMGSGKTIVINAAPTNSQLYYNGVLVGNNTVIPNYNPGKLQVKFTVSSVLSTSFTYSFRDAGGYGDLVPATYTINWAWLLKESILNFSGSKHTGSVNLSWQSVNETEGDVIVIERSVDGRTFTEIGRLNIEKTVGSANHQFTDNNPIENAGNFYRLKIINAGSVTEFSKVALVDFTQASAVQVFPNPFRDKLVVSFTASFAQSVTIRLVDARGSTIRQETFNVKKGQNNLEFKSLGSLPRTDYYIQLIEADRISTRKTFNQ